MMEIKCFLCCKKAITHNNYGKKGDLLRKELTVFFLVNKVLKVSSSLCKEFLENKGNPSDWFDCCEPCSNLILDAETVSKKITKLQNRRKCLVEEIEKFILTEHKKELFKDGQEQSDLVSSDVCRSIRTEVAGRLGLNCLDEVTVEVKAEPLDVEDEDLDNAYLPSPQYHESDGESSGESSNFSDEDEKTTNCYECKKCGKQYQYEQSFRSHIRKCKSKQVDDFMGKDGDGDIHECKNCGKQYKYVQSFQSHIKSCNSKQANEDISGNEDIEDSNVDAGTVQNMGSTCGTVCKVENVLESPSTQYNSEPEDQWEPPESNEALDQGSSSGENNSNTDRNESMKRKRGRPRKYFCQSKQKSAEIGFVKKYKVKSKTGKQKPFTCKCGESFRSFTALKTHKKECAKYSYMSVGKRDSRLRNPFTCKCGESFTEFSALTNHKNVCRKYSYMSVGLRDPISKNRNYQHLINNLKSNNPITKESDLQASEVPKVPKQTEKTKKALIVVKYLCLCSKKYRCKHRGALSRYKKECESAGQDLYEKNSYLIPESEHEVAKEVGHYPCRFCRLGFKNKSAYIEHLITQHNEHLKSPSKCKCCKKCFILENDLNIHIEATEICKNFIGPSKTGKVKNVPKSTDHVSYDDETTSSSSSDEYELIDDDDQEFDSGNAAVASGEQTGTNLSIGGLSTEDGQNYEEINETLSNLTTGNSKESEAVEPGSHEAEKKRLFRTFRCLTCKDGFKSPVLLNSHIRGVHKAQERPFVCHVCPDDFKSLGFLRSHYAEFHEGVQISSCPLVEGGIEEHKHRTLRKNKQKPKLTGYIIKKKVEDEFSDPDWDPENMEEYQSSKRESKRRFFITAEEYDPKYIHECKICGIKYETENLYVRHSLFAHFEEIGVGESDLVYHCDDCDKKYSTSGLLHGHKRAVHEGKIYPFECTVCHEEFKLYKQYLIHCEDSHTRDGPALCDICKTRFCDEESKTIHIRKVHENNSKPHRCSVCNMGYSLDMELRYHRLKHFREKYMCEFCSEPFAAETFLKRHQMKNHFEEMGVDPLKCTECGKIFGDMNTLNKHKTNVHVKDFICAQCGQGFSSEVLLERHVQERHVEGKKFLCTECPKQFWKKTSLMIHEKRAHSSAEPYKYKCEICQKTRTSEKLLKNHIEKMHSMLYKCHVCLKVFKEKRYLRVHLKGVHSVTVTFKSIKGYKVDEETLKEEISSNSHVVNRQDTSTGKEKRTLKVKIQSKKRKQENPKNVSECSSSLHGNTESTNSSTDFNAMPIPLIVPQPQMSTPSQAPSVTMPLRHNMDQLYQTSSNHLLGYGNNQHFMVPQAFSGSAQQNHLQNQHPSSSSYFHRNMQIHTNLYTPYSDPYEPFPQN